MKRLLLLFGMVSCWISALAQQQYTFTPAGATGQFGPTQTQVNTAYTGTSLAGSVTVNGGIQYWVVPQSGYYSIQALGAQGYGPFGGRGASMTGEFVLTAGDTLKILVGQEGAPPVGAGTNQYGGGGGSFVTYTDNTPLIVAGGGGGSWASNYTSTTDASITTAGNTAANGPTNGAGGTNGSGGADAGIAGGGGGLTGNGGGTPHGGLAFINGGTGGRAATNGGEGGFGGGGGANSWNNRRGGGGGGYSGGGGAGSTTSGFPEGGGGGSFNAGLNPVNLAGVQLGDGQVVITPLGFGAAYDVGVIAVDAPRNFCAGNRNVVVTIQNFGTQIINNVTLNWTINGTAQSPFSFTGTLDTIGGLGATSAQVTLGSYNFLASTPYTIKVWSSMPNNNADTVNMNDTVNVVRQSGLLAPTGLAATNVTAVSADISWNTLGGAGYVIEWGVTGFTPGTGNRKTGTGTNRTITNLTSNTIYDVYLADSCGVNDIGAFAGPVTFRTPCTIFGSPFSESFDGSDWVPRNGINPCWTTNPSAGSTWSWEPRSTAPTSGNGPLNDLTGGNYMYCEASISGTLPDAELISPPIDVSNLNTPALYFHQHRFSAGTIADMRIEVSNDFGTTWNTEYTVAGDIQTASGDPWSLDYVNLAAYTGDTVMIKFVQVFKGCCGDAAIDSVVVDEAPTCPWPTGLSISSITDSSAVAVWNDPSGTKWDLFWGPQGFKQGSPGTFSMTTTTNPDTLSGLLPNTAYDYYVRNNCTDSSNGVSLLIGPFTFRTACVSATAPFADDFDNNPANIVPYCWSANITGNRTTNGVAATYSFGTPVSSPIHIRFYNGNPAGPGDTTLLISPHFSDMTASDKRIKFYAQSTTTLVNELIVGSMTDPMDILSFTPLDTISLTTAYSLYVVNFNAANGYNGTDNYVAFRHGNSSTFRTIYIDDFIYEQIPSCNPPLISTLGSFNITSSGASVYWGAGTDGDETHVEYGLSGYTPGTGAALGSDSITGTMDTIGLSGLLPQTTYDVYIRDSCASDAYSPWVGPITFTTKCVLTQPATLPFVDGFETYAVGPYFEDQDFCFSSYYWDFQADDPNGRLRVQGGTGFYKSGTQAFSLDHSPSAAVVSNNFLTLAINLSNYTTANGIELNFSYLSHGQELNPNNRVWVRGSASDPWVEIYNLDVTNGQNGVYHDVSNLDIVGQLAAANQTVGANTQIRFGQSGRFSGSGLTFSDGYTFDDVSLVQVTCPTPTGLNAINVVDSGATLAWNTSTSASSYQVWFGPEGFYQGTATVGGHKRVVSNPQLILDTLRANVCYEFVVRYICGPGDSSFYQGPVSFCTPCKTFTAPFMENFEGHTVGFYKDEDDCWTIENTVNKTSATSGYGWELRNTMQTSSSGTGAAGDNTLYPATGGKFFNADVSYGTAGDSSMLISPIIDISGLTNPELKYHLHRFGSQMAYFYVDIYDGSNWINGVHSYTSLTGLQTANADPYLDTTISLLPYLGTTNFQVRFRTVSNGCCAGDNSLDDISIDNAVVSDLELASADFAKNSKCLSTNDTLVYTVLNVKGGTYDMSTDPLVLHYDITGPVNSTGSQTFNSGTINMGTPVNFTITGVNLSQPGVYTLNAWMAPNNYNLSALNDTLGFSVTTTIYPVWEVTPDTVVVITNMTDTVELKAESPFFGGDKFFISEVSHYYGFGSNPGTKPAYLLADDYIEITGVAGSDLGGITLEQWDGSSMMSSYTFPQGTLIGPNGTAIVAVGQLGSSVPSPSNFYYHGNGSYTGSFSSGGQNGRILKNASGVIIDAVGYSSTYTFPASSGVTPADWSGNTSSGSGTAGIRLIGQDINSASNWAVVSATSPQDANVLNTNVPLPAPSSTAGFAWTLNGNPIDTMPTTVVGPYSSSGVYNYIATFNGPCGVFSDTVQVVVNLPGSCPIPANLTGTAVACDSIVISWNNAADSSLVAFVTTGGTPTSTNLVIGDSSFAAVGVTPSTSYDFYVANICGSDTSFMAGPYTINSGTAGAPVADFTANSPAFNTTVEFDASPSFGARATYAWDFGDGNTSAGKNTIHTYAAGGSYNVKLTVTNACGTHDTTITLADVSIGENPIEQSLVVYPNPSSGEVSISFNNASNGDVAIRILDLSGKQVRVIHSQVAGNTYDERINIGDLADGVYMLEISSGGIKANRRLIKQ